MTSKTIDYYNKNANQYISTTVDVTFTETQDRFLEKLNCNARILDFGCGSGRDTKYFLEKGHIVDAIDGSEELCKCASQYTGIKVQNMLFQDFKVQNTYDGIWACSSILHLSRTELLKVFPQMIAALRDNGIIYTSFKYSLFEGERNGRYFTDFTIESFTVFLKGIQGILLEEYWITNDVRPGRGEEKWLNIILRKK